MVEVKLGLGEKQEETVKRLEPRELVRLLLNHGQLTLPKIAQLLDVNVGSADYHLKRLNEKGIVEIKKKSYGTTYSINPELTRVPIKLYAQLFFTYLPFVLAVFLFLSGSYFTSSILLFISSALGFILAYQQIVRYKKGRVKEILEAL